MNMTGLQPAPYEQATPGPYEQPIADPAAVLPRDTAPTCDTPPGAFLMSLNGYDEIAIANHFGARIGDLRGDPISGGRALAFIHQRRKGNTDPDAYKAAMNLTMQEVVDYFAPEPKADDPASAEGNAPPA